MAQQVPPQHIKDIFEAVDDDNSGYLDYNELNAVLLRMGLEDRAERQAKLDNLVKDLDPDGDGQITLDEFWQGAHHLGLAQVHENRSHLLARAAAVFDEMDQDGDNELDRRELTTVAFKLGVMEADVATVVDSLLNLLDEDGDGTVSRDEFLEAVKSGHMDALLKFAEEQGQETFASYGDDSGRRDVGSSQVAISISSAAGERHGNSNSTSPSNSGNGNEHGPGDGYDTDDGDSLFGGVVRRDAVTPTERRLPDRTEKTLHIPDEKYKYLWDIFCVADDDYSGEINEDELFELLNDKSIFGQKRIARNLITSVMDSIDKDNDGRLDFEEFCLAFDQLFDNDQRKSNKGILGAENEALIQENIRLSTQVEEYQQEIKLLSSNRAAKANTAALEQELRQLQEDSDAKDEQMRALSENKTAVDEQLREARIRIEELEQELEDRDAQLNSIKDKSRDSADHGTEYADVDLSAEVEQLKRELVTQASHFQQDMRVYQMQVALAELQLDEVGQQLLRVPDLEKEVSFLSQLSENLRVDLQNMVETNRTEADSATTAIEIEVTSLDEALVKLKDMSTQKRDVENRFHAHMERSQQMRAALESRNTQLSEEVASLKDTIEQLKEGTTNLFQQQQAEHEAKLETLEAELMEAREAQRKWEEYQANDSVRARVAGARLRLRPSSELAQQLRDTQRQLEDTQRQLAGAHGELDTFKHKTAEMWQLHEQSHEEQLSEAEAEAEALRQQLEEARARLQGGLKGVDKSSAADADTAQQTQQQQQQQQGQEERVQELEQQLEELRATASEASQRRLHELEAELQGVRVATLAELSEVHQAEMKRVREDADARVAELQRSLDDERSTGEELLGSLKHQLACVEHELRDKEAAAKGATDRLSRMEEEHANALERAKQQGADAETASLQLRDDLAKAKAAQSDVERLQTELSQREEERSRLLETIAGVNTRVEQLEEDLTAASAGQRDAADSSRRALEEEREKHGREVNALQETIDQLRQELAEAKLRHMEACEGYEEAIADLKQRLQHEEETVVSLKEQRERALASSSGSVLELQEKVSHLRTAHAEQEQELATKVRTYEEQLAAARAQGSATEAGLQAKADALQDELEQAKEARARALEEFKAALAHKQQDVDRLQATSEHVVAELTAKVEALTQQLEEAKREHEAAAAALDEQLQAARADATNKEEDHAAAVAALRAEVKDIEERMARVGREATQREKAARSKLSQQVQDLRSARDEADARVERLAQEQGKQKTDAQAREEKLQVQLREVKAQLKANKSETAALERARLRLLEDARASEQELEARIKQLESRNALLQEEVNRLIALTTRFKQTGGQDTLLRQQHGLQQRQEEEHPSGEEREGADRARASQQQQQRPEPEASKDLRKQLVQAESKLQQQTEEHHTRARELQALFEAERMQFDMRLREEHGRTELAQAEAKAALEDKENALADMRARLASKTTQMEEATHTHRETVANLRRQLADLERRHAGLQREHEALQHESSVRDDTERALASQTTQDLQQQVVSLRTKLDAAQKQAKQHDDEVAALRKEHEANLREQMALLESKHVAAAEQAYARVKQLEAAVVEAQGARRKAAEQFAHALKERGTKEAKAQQEQEQRLAQQQSRIGELEAAVDRYRREAAQTAAHLADARQSHEEQVALLRAEYDAKLARATVNLETAQREKGAPPEEVSTLRRQFRAKLDEQEALFEAERSSLQAHVRQLTDDRDALQEDLAETTAQLQGELDHLRFEHRSQVQRTHAAEAERDGLSADLARHKAAMAEQETALRAVELQRDRLREQLRAAGQPLSGTERSGYEQELQVLRTKVREQEALLGAANEEAERASADVLTRLREKDALFDGERGDAARRLRVVRAQLAEAQAAAQRAAAKKQATGRELEVLRAQLDQIGAARQEAARAFESRIAHLETQLAHVRDEKAQLAQELGQLKALDPEAVADLQARHAQQADELTDRVQTLAAKVRALEKERGALSAELRAQRDLAGAEQALRNGELHGAREEVKHLQEQMTAMDEERGAALLAVREEYEHQLTSLRSALDSKTAKVEELLHRAQDKEEAVRQAEAQAGAAASHAATELRDLQDQLAREKSERAVRELDAQEARSQVEQLAQQHAAKVADLRHQIETKETELEALRSAHRGDQDALVRATEERVQRLQGELAAARESRDALLLDFKQRTAENRQRLADTLAEKDAQLRRLQDKMHELSLTNDKLVNDKARLLDELTHQQRPERAGRCVSASTSVQPSPMKNKASGGIKKAAEDEKHDNAALQFETEGQAVSGLGSGKTAVSGERSPSKEASGRDQAGAETTPTALVDDVVVGEAGGSVVDAGAGTTTAAVRHLQFEVQQHRATVTRLEAENRRLEALLRESQVLGQQGRRTDEAQRLGLEEQVRQLKGDLAKAVGDREASAARFEEHTQEQQKRIGSMLDVQSQLRKEVHELKVELAEAQTELRRYRRPLPGAEDTDPDAYGGGDGSSARTSAAGATAAVAPDAVAAAEREREVAQLRARSQYLEGEMEQREARIVSLEEQLAAARLHLANTKDGHVQEEAKLAAMAEQAEAAAELADESRSISTTAYQSKLGDKQEELEAKEATVRRLNREVERLLSRVAALQGETESRAAERLQSTPARNLKAPSSTASTPARDSGLDASRAVDNADALRQQRDAATRRAEALQSEVLTLMRQLDHERATIKQREAHAAASTATAGSGAAPHAAAAPRDDAHAESGPSAVEEHMHKLVSELARVQAERDAATREFEAQLDAAHRSAAERDEAVAALKAQAARLQAELERVGHGAEGQSEGHVKDGRCNVGTAEHQRLVSDLAKAEGALAAAQEENEGLHGRLSSLEPRARTAEQAQAGLRQSLMERKEAAQGFRARVQDLERRLRRSQQENRQLLAELKRRDGGLSRTAAAAAVGDDADADDDDGLTFVATGGSSKSQSHSGNEVVVYPTDMGLSRALRRSHGDERGRRVVAGATLMQDATLTAADDTITSSASSGAVPASDATSNAPLQGASAGQMLAALHRENDGLQVKVSALEAELAMVRAKAAVPSDAASSSGTSMAGNSSVHSYSRVRQLQLELQRVLKERQEVVKVFQHRLGHMEERLREASRARSKLAQELISLSQDGALPGRIAGVGRGGDDGANMQAELWTLQRENMALQQEVQRLREGGREELRQQRRPSPNQGRAAQLEWERDLIRKQRELKQQRQPRQMLHAEAAPRRHHPQLSLKAGVKGTWAPAQHVRAVGSGGRGAVGAKSRSFSEGISSAAYGGNTGLSARLQRGQRGSGTPWFGAKS